MLRVALDRWCCSWTVITVAVRVNAYSDNTIVYVIALFCNSTDKYKIASELLSDGHEVQQLLLVDL